MESRVHAECKSVRTTLSPFPPHGTDFSGVIYQRGLAEVHSNKALSRTWVNIGVYMDTLFATKDKSAEAEQRF